MKIYRNSQKRYYEDNAVYFVTIKTHQDYPYFKESIFCDLLIEEIKVCKEMKEFNLYGFCIIYNHVHLLLQPGEEYNISKVMQFLKRHFTRNVNYIMDYSHELSSNPESDIGQCRFPKEECNIIQGFNNKVINFRNKYVQRHGIDQNKFIKFKWRRSFYDHMIRDERDLENQYIYTVYNFQKHNLPKDWKYTSLNYNDMIDTIGI